MVKLGMTVDATFVPRYRGSTTATSLPSATSALGSASTTSARPPVFEKGRPSEATKRILIISVVIPVRSNRYRFYRYSGGGGASSLAQILQARKIRKSSEGQAWRGSDWDSISYMIRAGVNKSRVLPTSRAIPTEARRLPESHFAGSKLAPATAR